jgi:glyoxylase-like metal-dependent hydrolase (beta-lactamase superfamily II)
MREIITLDVGGDANRSYCLLDAERRTAWCVDPSFGAVAILALCTQRQVRLTEILLTHTHGDHVATLPDLVRATRARVWVHPLELARAPGAVTLPEEGPLPEVPGVETLYTPGHTPGGTCYLVGDALFTGDVLFVDWVGRCDLPGGDSRALFRSLAKLRSLQSDVAIYPGHHYGSVESRRLGEEIRLNKFLQCRDYGKFMGLLPELVG